MWLKLEERTTHCVDIAAVEVIYNVQNVKLGVSNQRVRTHGKPCKQCHHSPGRDPFHQVQSHRHDLRGSQYLLLRGGLRRLHRRIRKSSFKVYMLEAEKIG